MRERERERKKKMSTALLAINTVLIAGLIAGVVINGVLYGQTLGPIANVTETMSNSSVSPFVLLISSNSPERFPILENVAAAYMGYQIIESPLGIEITLGGAGSYVNATVGYVKIGVNNVFPAEFPFSLVQPKPVPIIVTIADQITGLTYPTLGTVTFEPNGLDVLFEFSIPPGAPPDDASGATIVFMPITVHRYPK